VAVAGWAGSVGVLAGWLAGAGREQEVISKTAIQRAEKHWRALRIVG